MPGVQPAGSASRQAGRQCSGGRPSTGHHKPGGCKTPRPSKGTQAWLAGQCDADHGGSHGPPGVSEQGHGGRERTAVRGAVHDATGEPWRGCVGKGLVGRMASGCGVGAGCGCLGPGTSSGSKLACMDLGPSTTGGDRIWCVRDVRSAPTHPPTYPPTHPPTQLPRPRAGVQQQVEPRGQGAQHVPRDGGGAPQPAQPRARVCPGACAPSPANMSA